MDEVPWVGSDMSTTLANHGGMISVTYIRQTPTSGNINEEKTTPQV